MISQSENNIKKSALRFLKMYYKYRPRTGKTDVKVDQSTKEGIIADGLLTFPQEDELSFTASVEATSFDTRDEVKFKMQHQLLNWDAFMWGFFLIGIVVLFGHYFHLFAFQKGHLELTAALSILFLSTFISYRYFFAKRAKYRYIYALEQFRQYHVDEQWVAIGDNVFYGAEDPAYEELKIQCVRNGFGLLSIDKELNTHLVISASREELFGSGRQVLSFMGADNLVKNPTLNRARGFWGSLKSKIGWTTPNQSVLRYRRSFYKPIFASVVMLGLIGFVAYEDLREKEFDYVKNEAKYNEDLKEAARHRKNGEFDQFTDSSAVEPYQKKRPDSYLAIVEKDKRDEFIMKRAPLRKKEKLTTKGGTEIIVESSGKNMTGYDCSRFFNFYGKKHLVQDGIFKGVGAAERRMNLLRRSGFKANLLWLGCFYSDSEDYIVYIEWLYEEKEEAIREGLTYRKKLKEEGIKESDLNVRTIEK
ncbi:MAG: hypothetical protein AB8F94_09960 [Saprospiraceae bacterium]